MFKKPKKIPTNPGIYIFSRGTAPLYIGKALNLKKRVVSYFRKNDGLPPKIQKMLTEATSLKFIEAASEIEALIKEAELIKKFRPKYNALMRDDKNYFFVGITKEAFPRIYVTHQPQQIKKLKGKSKNQNLKLKTFDAKYIGPFTDGGALYATLKLLRRVFPYCTCKRTHKRPCLNSQIGKCPGYCCIKIEKEKRKRKNHNSKLKSNRIKYRRNINNIIAILTGKKTRLTAELKKRLKEAAKSERYEEAARLRDQIWGLESVFAHRQVLGAPDSKAAWPWLELMPKLQALLKTKAPIRRMECYDVANIAGREATGSMVVFIDGRPAKSEYRKFRIKTVAGISDTDMIKEVLSRRLKHTEWLYPELVVVDGGKGQLGAALSVLRKSEILNPKSEIPMVTALAKREEILFAEGRRAIYLQKQDQKILHLFQRIRDESHRFARRYHHLLRKKSLNV